MIVIYRDLYKCDKSQEESEAVKCGAGANGKSVIEGDVEDVGLTDE